MSPPVKKVDDIDTTSVLKKLTLQGKGKSGSSVSNGKQTNGTGGGKIESDSNKKQHLLSVGPDTEANTSVNRFSTPGVKDPSLPVWYEDLGDDDVGAFKEIFDTLDGATGTINADSLYEGLRRVDSAITYEEVHSVLKTLDKDGNGEIDFDEFLFHMTQSESQKSGKAGNDDFTKRQRLFFSAITRFTLKDNLGDIEKSYLAHMRQSNALSHYTAGVRLIGLTDRQLAREMKKMQRSLKQVDSPYAKPLPFVAQKGSSLKPPSRETQQGKRVAREPFSSQYQLNTSVQQISANPIDVHQLHVPTVPSLFNLDHEESLKFLTSTRGSGVAKLPDAHLIQEYRHKIVSDELKNKLHGSKDGAKPPDERRRPRKMRNPPRKGRKPSQWTSRLEQDTVPLPVLKIRYKNTNKPTIDDLPNIREKANQAMDDYYQKLRGATVQNAWDHWDRLYADTIRPKKLLENFRTVYRAYSPHKEEEAFVVCPWIPGLRHIGHSRSQVERTTKKSEHRITLTPESMFLQRPYSAFN